MNKKRLSVRINPYNYDFLRAVADILFFDKNKNEGNLSGAVDWVITVFRLDSKYKHIASLIIAANRYQRGSRTKEDIEAYRNLMVRLKYVEDDTEK